MKNYAILILAVLAAASCSNSVNTTESATQAVESVIMSRRSVRKYVDRPISREILDEIMDAGINAPNGQNRQAYEVFVVDDSEFLAAVSSAVLSEGSEVATPRSAAGSLFFNAPCVVFIANDTSYDMSQVDCGLLGENIILSAWSRGIGSCCLAGPVRQMKASEACAPLIRRMGFSEGYNLLYCIALGYPDESPDAKPRKADKVRYVEQAALEEAAALEEKYAPKIEVGTPVDDFTVKTSTGEDFTFSSLKGSYVVLDFWASWCPDCREEIPALKELWKEFEPKGVKFVSFSVDDSEEAWKGAIAEDGMEWLQVSNLIKWKDNPVANFFGMGWIPTMFLIDPDGNIAGFALTAASMKTLLQNI